MIVRSVLLAVLVASATACGGGGGGEQAASQGAPRAFTRNDGGVTSTFNVVNNNYTATQVVTISNNDSGASRGVVALTADSASITSSANASGYQIQVTFTATAPTDAEARAALATMSVSHRDATDPGVLYLDNHVSVPSYNANNTSRSASVVAALPQTLGYRLIQDVGAGSIGSTGLTGTSAEFDASAGSATLGGTWDAATLTTGAGSIVVTADAANLYASSGLGSVTVTLPSLRATQANLSSSSGAVDATVSHAGAGVFDADAVSDIGSASVSITGTSAVGTQSTTHQHYRSPNYDSGSPKIAVVAHSGSGSAFIHD